MPDDGFKQVAKVVIGIVSGVWAITFLLATVRAGNQYVLLGAQAAMMAVLGILGVVLRVRNGRK